MRFRPVQTLLLAVLFLPLLTTCRGTSGGTATLTLAPESALPAQVRQSPPQVQEAYRFALANQELSKIPCYCGCGFAPHLHRNNRDCYIDDIRPDGTVVWEQHALT